MLIGIDGNEANVKERVGVNVYAFELLCSINELAEACGHRLIVYLKNPPLSDLPKENEFLKYKVLPGKGAWILTKLMPHLFTTGERPDILFTPSHYLPPFSPIPMVASIMDLGYLEFSGQFKKYDYWQLKYWSAISISISKAIITISESSKRDIVRHYNFASKKVRVTYPGYDKERFNINISPENVRLIKKKYSIVNDYALFLGTLKPSKNIEGLLTAFSSVFTNSKLQERNLKLVISGKKGWLYESIFKKVKDLGLEKEVIFTDFIDEKDKPALIKGAKVFVLPSFWEGFGLDVLSAMACGVPVVISKVGSLPEVGGKAATYVDPKDTNSISEAVLKVLSIDNLEYNKLVEKGLKQAHTFSWEKCAKETLKILEGSIK